ncbi:hypothetical protein GLAREA_03667 [Glarea lozoyensis ATCC 20868]|uniref:Uncharacterized protein n=1 Tax=Glarea lozoyensis (strain ATCC 20868 / MF5171) TaxID=1116229 RepID=S3CYN5_GLAL2|nr:uncharacterized protein GLAREA_03667 [Glarea lozoyensis ATCC 20868]EPE30700.1 hypothetical protein GLAREA_03667 [Glarea lozoyensis ATCC 20868]
MVSAMNEMQCIRSSSMSKPSTSAPGFSDLMGNRQEMTMDMSNQYASGEQSLVDDYPTMDSSWTRKFYIQTSANNVTTGDIFDENLSYSENLSPNYHTQFDIQSSFLNQTRLSTATTPADVPDSEIEEEIWGDSREEHRDMSWKSAPKIPMSGSPPVRPQMSKSALRYPTEGDSDAESHSELGSPQPFQHVGKYNDFQATGRASSTSQGRDRDGYLMSNYIFHNPTNSFHSRIPVPVEGEPANIHEKSGISIRIKEGELFQVRRNYQMTKDPDVFRKVYLAFSEYKQLMILRGKPERISEWPKYKQKPFPGTQRNLSKEGDITGTESSLFSRHATALNPLEDGNVDTSGLTLNSPIFDDAYSTDGEYSDTSMSSDDEDSFSLPPLPTRGSKGTIPYNKRFDHGQIQAHLTEKEMCIIRKGYAPDNLLALSCFRKPQSPSLINSLAGQRNNPEVTDIRRTRITQAEWTKLQEIRGYPNVVYDDEYKGSISKADRDRGNFHLEQHLERLRHGDRSRNRRSSKEKLRMRRSKRRSRSSQ